MAKYKLKTHSGAKRRFHLTGSGKIMRRKVGISHNRRKKLKEVHRLISKTVPVEGGLVRRIRRLLPYGLK